jgi:hypothetical protein
MSASVEADLQGWPRRPAGRKRTLQEQMILFLRLAKPLPFAVYADFADTAKPRNPNNNRLFMVPVERIELPTFGLQNRWASMTLRLFGRPSPGNVTRTPAYHINYLANAVARDEKLAGEG